MPEDVRARFAPVAANYAKAAFHTSSERLREVLDLAQPKATDLALDVATGTGNTALALAPFVRRVVGLDLTREMLAHAGRLTSERSVANAEWVLGDASRLPFADDSFDVYTVRAAPHHFTDFDAFLFEALRVLKPGGSAAFVDCAPPPAAREVMHEVEVRRDPSHVRSLTVAEWPSSTRTAWPVATSHVRALLSTLAVTSSFPLGLKATEVNASVCPVSLCSRWPLATFHSVARPSSPAVATRFPSGLKAAATTEPL